MDEKKRKMIVYAVFVAALIWGGWHFLQGSEEMPVAATEDAVGDSTAVAAADITKSIPFEEYAALEWGSDPFYRGHPVSDNGDEEPSPPGWSLDGIMYKESAPMAVINRNIVKSGDLVNGARIIEIKKDRVVLEKDGMSFILNIAEGKS